MDKYLYPTRYNGCKYIYLSLLGLNVMLVTEVPLFYMEPNYLPLHARNYNIYSNLHSGTRGILSSTMNYLLMSTPRPLVYKMCILCLQWCLLKVINSNHVSDVWVSRSNGNRSISQIPQWIFQMSHNAPFCNRKMHTRIFVLQNDALWNMELVHCGRLFFEQEVYWNAMENICSLL